MWGISNATLARFFAAMALIFVVAFSLGETAAASAWGRRGGELFVLTRADVFEARGSFLASSFLDGEDRFRRLESNFYTEYGLTDRLTLGGKLVYGESRITGARETIAARGVTVAEAFVQQKVWSPGNSVGAVRVGVAIPASFDSGVRRELLSEGADVELRALYGHSSNLFGAPVFGSFESAYRKRISNSADQAIVDATLGVEPHRMMLFLLRSSNTVSIRNESESGADFDIYRIQPSLVIGPRNRFSLEVGFISEYAGRNFDRGNTYFVGIWSRF